LRVLPAAVENEDGPFLRRLFWNRKRNDLAH